MCAAARRLARNGSRVRAQRRQARRTVRLQRNAAMPTSRVVMASSPAGSRSRARSAIDRIRGIALDLAPQAIDLHVDARLLVSRHRRRAPARHGADAGRPASSGSMSRSRSVSRTISSSRCSLPRAMEGGSRRNARSRGSARHRKRERRASGCGRCAAAAFGSNGLER